MNYNSEESMLTRNTDCCKICKLDVKHANVKNGTDFLSKFKYELHSAMNPELLPIEISTNQTNQIESLQIFNFNKFHYFMFLSAHVLFSFHITVFVHFVYILI